MLQKADQDISGQDMGYGYGDGNEACIGNGEGDVKIKNNFCFFPLTSPSPKDETGIVTITHKRHQEL